MQLHCLEPNLVKKTSRKFKDKPNSIFYGKEAIKKEAIRK